MVSEILTFTLNQGCTNVFLSCIKHCFDVINSNVVKLYRSSVAFQILSPRLVSFCKISLIYTQRNVIIASLYSFSALYWHPLLSLSNQQTNYSVLATQSFMVCLQQLACICSLIAMIADSDEISEASQLLNCVSDWVYCT